MVGRSYTTGHHLFVKVLIFVAWGALLTLSGFAAELLATGDYQIIPLLILGTLATLLVIYLENRFDAQLDALASYLHIRESLDTPVSFREAAELSFLFVANSDGKYYPLLEVLKLPKSDRKTYLFDVAKKIRGR